jgi:hypothetical protein
VIGYVRGNPRKDDSDKLKRRGFKFTPRPQGRRRQAIRARALSFTCSALVRAVARTGRRIARRRIGARGQWREVRRELDERRAKLGVGALPGDDVGEERGDVAAVVPAPVVRPLERHPRSDEGGVHADLPAQGVGAREERLDVEAQVPRVDSEDVRRVASGLGARTAFETSDDLAARVAVSSGPTGKHSVLWAVFCLKILFGHDHDLFRVRRAGPSRPGARPSSRSCWFPEVRSRTGSGPDCGSSVWLFRFGSGQLTDRPKILAARNCRMAMNMDSVMASVAASVKYGTSLQEKSDENLWKSFSVSDFLVKDMVDTISWEHHKNLGNELMKIGDYTGAASHYHTAWNIAVGPVWGENFDEFRKVITLWPSGTPRCRLAGMKDVLENIATHLIGPFSPVLCPVPNAEPVPVWPPNKAAGIALGNKSAALLAAGDAKGALECASMATSYDPSYVKGHFREMKALLALGRKKEAEEKRLQMIGYEEGCSQYPVEYIPLLGVAWISLEQAYVVYAPIVRKQMLDSVAAALPLDPFGNGNRYTTLEAMLVPFAGGQSLLLRLHYFPSGQGVRTLSCLGFFLVDPDNATTVELPPHGRASLRSAEEIPHCIHAGIEWAQDAGLKVISVIGCQGLAYSKACRVIADHLAAHGQPVPVSPADSTHAGDVFALTLAEMARNASPHALAAAAAAGQWDPASVWGRPPAAAPPFRAAAPAARGVRLRPRRRREACRRLRLLL